MAELGKKITKSTQYCLSDMTRELQLSSKVHSQLPALEKSDNLSGGHMWGSSPALRKVMMLFFKWHGLD